MVYYIVVLSTLHRGNKEKKQKYGGTKANEQQ